MQKFAPYQSKDNRIFLEWIFEQLLFWDGVNKGNVVYDWGCQDNIFKI